MNSAALKKIELVRKLSEIPENKLDRLKKYVDTLRVKPVKRAKRRLSLKGIWMKKGFEKIMNLEKEIKKVRKELQASILKRKI